MGGLLDKELIAANEKHVIREIIEAKKKGEGWTKPRPFLNGYEHLGAVKCCCCGHRRNWRTSTFVSYSTVIGARSAECDQCHIYGCDPELTKDQEKALAGLHRQRKIRLHPSRVKVFLRKDLLVLKDETLKLTWRGKRLAAYFYSQGAKKSA